MSARYRGNPLALALATLTTSHAGLLWLERPRDWLLAAATTRPLNGLVHHVLLIGLSGRVTGRPTRFLTLETRYCIVAGRSAIETSRPVARGWSPVLTWPWFAISPFSPAEAELEAEAGELSSAQPSSAFP